MQPNFNYRGPTPVPLQGSPRSWAVTFLASGTLALACIPTVFLFEHFRWWEAPVHLTAFGASVVCASSAAMFVLRTRKSPQRTTLLGLPTRTLAYVALGLAGGFLALIAGFLLFAALVPSDF